MPREAIAVTITDLSDFARRLRRELDTGSSTPSHLTLLNMLARATGHANFQHLRAGASCSAVVQSTAFAADPKKVAVALRLFDDHGRMVRWPKKTSVQALCLWALWARLPARIDLTEPDVNRIAEAFHLFGDRAILRRSLIDHGLAERAADASWYRRVERAPTPEAIELIRALSGRK
jgi:hypothetical protein